MGRMPVLQKRGVTKKKKKCTHKVPERSSARTYPFYIRTSGIAGAGMGVYTQENIKARTHIGFYAGKEYTLKEWDDDVDDIQSSDYLMTVENNRHVELYYVDARNLYHSNFTRYINCACRRKDINCEIHHVFDKKKRRWRPTIRATRAIPQGTELFMDYGKDYTKQLFGRSL